MIVFVVILMLIVTGVLALRYRWFLNLLDKEENERRKSFKPMLSDKVPYEAYKRIAAKGPVKTEPIYKSVDFLEFILEHSEKNSKNSIESNLANIDVGETTL